jgi:signal transduction histidine kinase
MDINRLDQEYLKTLTVLYVEDDDDTREQFSEFLRRPVGTLITAGNGVEGLDAYKTHAPDIVVTDILMPIMDGLVMAHEIRGIDPRVPIVVITAFEQTDYLVRAINVGVDKYVTKPVNSYLLFDCLLECAHRLRAEEQLKLVQERKIQDMLMKHHKIVSVLAGGMAHDYNNLLQAILGYASLAKMNDKSHSENSVNPDHVEQCFAEARELGQMLLILGEENSESMQSGAVMPHIQETIQTAVSGTSVTLSLDLDDDNLSVKYMWHQMQMVFSRLVANALDAMPSGGTLHLSAKKTIITELDALPLVSGAYLHISLSDTGTGMTPDVLSKIFDPYFSTKQKSGQRGMGLSLSLCHTIIMKHGGIITAESEPESGSAFHIWLPLTEATIAIPGQIHIL